MYRVLIFYVFACTALNTYFLPSSNYYHKDFLPEVAVFPRGEGRYLEESAPVRSVTSYFNRNHPNSAVLLTNTTAIART